LVDSRDLAVEEFAKHYEDVQERQSSVPETEQRNPPLPGDWGRGLALLNVSFVLSFP
jgi:hypothetical protein